MTVKLRILALVVVVLIVVVLVVVLVVLVLLVFRINVIPVKLHPRLRLVSCYRLCTLSFRNEYCFQ